MNKRKSNHLEDTPSGSNECSNITLIERLVFSMSLWTIRALVFAKSPYREWKKNNKTNSVINFDVEDTSGKIRVVAYNQFAEKMNNLFNVGDVMQLTKGVLVPTNKLWCKLGHQITINISKYSVFEKLPNSVLNLKLKISFKSIAEILKLDIGHSVNLVAIALLCRDCEITRNSDQKKFLKKEVLLFDSSCKKIVLTLWQQVAEKFVFKENMIISITNALVTKYYTKSLSAESIEINPQTDMSIKLLKWFNQNKNKITLPSFESDDIETVLLNDITIQSIKIGNNLFVCKASFVDFKDINEYEACEKCMKKISLLQGMYVCDFCQNSSFSCKTKFMMKISIVDESKQIWLTLFENHIKQLLNKQNIESVANE